MKSSSEVEQVVADLLRNAILTETTFFRECVPGIEDCMGTLIRTSRTRDTFSARLVEFAARNPGFRDKLIEHVLSNKQLFERAITERSEIAKHVMNDMKPPRSMGWIEKRSVETSCLSELRRAFPNCTLLKLDTEFDIKQRLCLVANTRRIARVFGQAKRECHPLFFKFPKDMMCEVITHSVKESPSDTDKYVIRAIEQKNFVKPELGVL